MNFIIYNLFYFIVMVILMLTLVSPSDLAPVIILINYD